jgi:predicted AAA+ superfamily ATPase
MFSKNLATLLTGRTVELKIYPFSFKELYQKIKQKEESDESFLNRYLVYGGLGIILDSYYDKTKTNNNLKKVTGDTIEKDIVNRHKIKKDISAFNKIVSYCFEHVGRNINSITLEKHLRDLNISLPTIINYITWLCDSQLLQNVIYYDIKGLKALKTSGTYYAGDLGILSANIGFDSTYSKGYRLENLVLIQLLSLGYEIVTGYDKNENSVDFIAIKDDEKIYIQVTDQMNEENADREYKSLLKTKNATKKVILTNAMNVPKKDNGVKIIFLTD